MLVSVAFQLLLCGKLIQNCEEECVNAFMWLVDKALHHDAFMQQTARLKEFKYKMQRMRVQYNHNKLHFNSCNKASKMR